MKSKLLISALAALGTAAFVTLIYWCFFRTTHRERLGYNDAYNTYLSAYTYGEVSRTSPITLRFVNDMVDTSDRAKWTQCWSFEPAIKGDVHWTSSNAMSFVPDEPLTPGEIYVATVDLKPVFPDIPNDLRFFRFDFQCKKRMANVSPISTTAFMDNEGKYYRLTGSVTTHNDESYEEVKKLLAANVKGKDLFVKWSHVSKTVQNQEVTKHTFIIDSLPREENPYPVYLNWKGNDGEEMKVLVSGKNDFSVKEIKKFADQGEKYVIVEFSDELDRTQSLEGLITIEGQKNLKYTIEDNRVTVFPSKGLVGKFKVNVSSSVKNLMGQNLKAPETKDLIFDALKPQVRIVGKGVIMPQSDKLPFVFEAAGLKKIDVRVIRILEKNVPQFLQVNNLDGNNELRRVGKIIVDKTIDLGANKDLNLNEWNYHSFDLAGLINPEPGAIYNVAIGFRRSYTLWEGCAAPEPEKDDDGNILAPEEQGDPSMFREPTEWETSGSGYEYDYSDYYDEGWADDSDPCDYWYYNRSHAVYRNIIASDLGLVAKSGSGGTFIACTNLKTTEPMAGVDLEFVDYQNVVYQTAKTDSKGQLFIKLPKAPHLLIGKYGTQRGYLRMNDGSAISTSRYDVSGAEVQNGLRGFIYGERGVWRPGDEMFINFILEDKEKTLPAGHPVTFELRGPRGQIVQRITKTEGLNGFYNFTCKTAPDAFTGNYLARVRVGGAVFEKTLKVETIMPNRLKLNLDFGSDIIASKTANNGVLSAEWLTGASAKGLKADVKVRLSPKRTTFAKFPDHSFDDPSRFVNSDEITLFNAKLDDKGKANVAFKTELSGKSAGFLNANFKTRVFEPGGAFSVDRFQSTFSPYDVYVGIATPHEKNASRDMLLTDKNNKIDIQTVTPDGRAISGRNISWAIYKMDWRWWFDRSRDEEYSYRSSMEKDPIDSGELTTDANGKGSFNFLVKYPEYGRYFIRAEDEEGHAGGQIVYVDYPSWQERMGNDGDQRGPTVLTFATNKEKYSVGETATVSIPSPNGGRALITVENANRVLRADWVLTTQGVTTYSFPITAEMSPNVFVTVSLLQPHAQTANDLPMRMYGIVPILVDDPTTQLQPEIAMSETLEPGKEFSVKVSEKGKGPMTYTLAIVDEGLLGLTRFKTPNPWADFYQRQALGVKTWDLYDMVIGMFKGEIKSLLSIGGDAMLQNADKPDRFKPVCLYVGPFSIGKGESKTHTFKMPNYFGEVRVMVVAGQDGRYGSAEKAVKVKQPLMALGTLPRVLRPAEELAFPLTVFSMDDNIKDVSIKVEADGLISVMEASKSLNFKEQGEQTEVFRLKVAPRTGKGHVKATVTGGGRTAVYETDIDVINPNPSITDLYAQRLDGNQSWTASVKMRGMEGTNKAAIEVSSIPPLNLNARLKYLIHYPYGCLEQTTSSVFPQLYVGRLSDLTPTQKADVDKNIRDGIARIYNFQRADGRLSYWPGQEYYNDWTSVYATHFLIEAKRVGYNISDEVLNKDFTFLRKQANDYVATPYEHDALTQAYRLFILALSGNSEMGAMNRLKSQVNTTNVCQWLLAASYYVSGQKDVAKKMTKDLSTTVKEYRYISYTFGTDMRDEAFILMALCNMNRSKDGVNLVQKLSDRLSNNNWYSTQEVAASLTAISQYLGDNKTNDKISLSYRINGGDWKEISTDKVLVQVELPDAGNIKTVEFKNKGGNVLYPRVVTEGIPLMGDNSVAANNLKVSTQYRDEKGRVIDVDALTQGTDFVAEVTVTNTSGRYYSELVLNQIFPSGWEIHNNRMDGTSSNSDAFVFQDIRDDRVYTFFNLDAGKSATYRVSLNAAYKGKYGLPSVTAEAMYDNTISARAAGTIVEVK